MNHLFESQFHHPAEHDTEDPRQPRLLRGHHGILREVLFLCELAQALHQSGGLVSVMDIGTKNKNEIEQTAIKITQRKAIKMFSLSRVSGEMERNRERWEEGEMERNGER